MSAVDYFALIRLNRAGDQTVMLSPRNLMTCVQLCWGFNSAIVSFVCEIKVQLAVVFYNYAVIVKCHSKRSIKAKAWRVCVRYCLVWQKLLQSLKNDSFMYNQGFFLSHVTQSSVTGVCKAATEDFIK